MEQDPVASACCVIYTLSFTLPVTAQSLHILCVICVVKPPEQQPQSCKCIGIQMSLLGSTPQNRLSKYALTVEEVTVLPRRST